MTIDPLLPIRPFINTNRWRNTNVDTMPYESQTCTQCGCYLRAPLAWWAVTPPPMCHCPHATKTPLPFVSPHSTGHPFLTPEELMKRITENLEKGKKPFSPETTDTTTILQQLLTSQQQTLAAIQELSQTLKELVSTLTPPPAQQHVETRFVLKG